MARYLPANINHRHGGHLLLLRSNPSGAGTVPREYRLYSFRHYHSDAPYSGTED